MASNRSLSDLLKNQTLFGKLTVIGEGPMRPPYRRTVRLRCECGREVVCLPFNLLKAAYPSCGCDPSLGVARAARLRAGNIKHGDATHTRRAPEYRIWQAMSSRCYNPKVEKYACYGGRGIQVADEWRGPGGYEKFIAHIGKRPGPGLSIDRIDNEGHYEPGNVRWATKAEQMANRRVTRS